LWHEHQDPRGRDTAYRYIDDPERVLRWGYKRYYRAPEDVMATDLGAVAARQALARAGLDAKEVDLIVVAASDIPEYLNWDFSAALARALELECVPTLALTQGCTSGVTALASIAGAMAIAPEMENVLLVATNRISEAHRNRMRFNTCLGSDGAAAVVVRRGHPRGQWLATEQLTYPEYVDMFRTEFGGTALPHPPSGITNLDVDTVAGVLDHFERDTARFQRFVHDVHARAAEVARRACARAGADLADVRKFIFLNDNQNAMKTIAKAAGIPIERTNADLSAELGHIGCADQLVCLHEYTERGELAPGDLVTLTSLSGGMHWASTLVRV
jgi:3-oxoacyl-[acyl-carrier-protein] synthase-3